MSQNGAGDDRSDASIEHAVSSGPPRDWTKLLTDFLGDDARAASAAARAFSGVIEGKLYALGAYHRRQSCEDLIHDVLLALFEHGATVEQPAAWLRRATFNAYIDTIRRERRAALRLHEAASRSAPAPVPMLDDSVVTKDELDELHRALAKLPPTLRSVVDVVYPADPEREPRSLADAADAMKIELHTLKNRLRRAMRELGREMRRERTLGRFMAIPGFSSLARHACSRRRSKS